ncbi:MAG: histidine phosphatase family protein [Nanoarchaeota archaeon]|nr:histidine phosphatase family protein [Nanoarchaeota archaeon]MBU0977887.1 histidine phosphatase family protein [Nanoarchaeota archaeon]
MKVYFMRHGESEYNVVKRINFNPKVEVGLTVKGKDQVKKVAMELFKLRFDAVYSSQFERAKESAKIMAEGRKLKVRGDVRLNEMKYGLEGESAEDYYSVRSDAESLSEFKLEGYESFLDVKSRVYDFLQGLRKKKYARVLVVAHEAVVQAARTLFNEFNDEEAFTTPIKNGQYFMFDM